MEFSILFFICQAALSQLILLWYNPIWYAIFRKGGKAELGKNHACFRFSQTARIAEPRRNPF